MLINDSPVSRKKKKKRFALIKGQKNPFFRKSEKLDRSFMAQILFLDISNKFIVLNKYLIFRTIYLFDYEI